MPGLDTLFAIALLAGAALPLVLAVRLARHQELLSLAPVLLSRTERLAPLLGVLLGTSLWVGAYALELILGERVVSVWLHRLVYVGIAVIPPAALLTALEVVGRRPSRARERLLWGLLAPIPATTVLLALTNDHQGLLWAPGALIEVGRLTPIDTVRGPWFEVHTAFSYTCLATAFALLGYHYIREHRRFLDAAALLVAFVTPWVANFLHVFLEVGDAIDLTPAAFLITGLILYRTVNRDLLAEILPVARATVLEMLGDAVLVLDERGRVLDANRSALAILNDIRPDLTNAPSLPPLSECWPALAARIEGDEARSTEVVARSGSTGVTQRFDLRVTRLEPHSGLGLRALRAVALRDVTGRRETEVELYRRAHFDGLTGLANRDHFFDRMAGALGGARKGGYPLAVLLIDLDRFKLVNDANGHAAGDALLRGVAAQLLEGLRDSDVVARIGGDDDPPHLGRLGGDEFAVVLPRIAAAEDAGDVANRLLRALEASLRGRGETVAYAGASIGISIFPDDGQDAEALLKHADVALYQAKEWGGNRFEYSNARLARIAERRAAIDRELRAAIASDQLSLMYQPKVRLKAEGLSGTEALLRWSHPELGSVPASEFIPIAEKTGLVQPLGTWVIDRTCRQIRAWRDAGLLVPPVAVNVSSLQLSSADFVDTVTRALRRHDLRPEDLELEITEHTILTIDDSTFVALRDLRAIGIRIALDDFGTGYSALSCLNRFEIDTLKIDRSLLEGIDANERAAGIISSVITLAHTLEMKVVAEGVEREELAEVLRRLGCDEAQGFLYSRPLPPDELAEFLRRG